MVRTRRMHTLIFPFDYIYQAENGAWEQPDQEVLARLGLHLLFDPDRFTVDVSEIRNMGYQARIHAMALISYCLQNPESLVKEDTRSCAALLNLAAQANQAEAI